MAQVAAHHGIVFIGFMAAGKTRAAHAVAERLGLGVTDTDDLLEGELGEPISSFFEREGEVEFRRREERLVISVLNALASQVGGPSSVVALGGGAIESEAVRRALGDHMPVWCDVDEETAWERASGSDRPLAVDRATFAERFASRRPLYESLARAILPSAARDAAGPAAPWLAAMQGTPGVRMIWAESESGSYPAVVGEGAIGLLDDAREALPEALPARTFCVADDEALRHHRSLLPRAEAVIGVQGAETSKTIAEAERILGELSSAGANRDDCVLAFGGGVVGDLAGFCAATYQRGVPLVQAPTTLVAQVDSAYGGKTGVDLPQAKNYVGAYHMPTAVLADPATLATLPQRGACGGLRRGRQDGADRGRPALVPGEGDRVSRSRSADRRDLRLRPHQDRGRGLGREGLRAADGPQPRPHDRSRHRGRDFYTRYRHGEAVGLGLLAVLRLSDADRLRDEVEGLLASHGLPVSLDPSVSTDGVMEAMGRDKKQTREGLGFVLLSEPGEPRWGQRVEADRVRAVVEELK